MANEQRPKGECPFCGSEAYECVTKWMGEGQYRRAAAYYRCRKGTMAECESAWRSHVRALAKGGSRGKA